LCAAVSQFNKGDFEMRKVIEIVRRGTVAGGASGW
jgi:hypothetical protein